VPTCPGGWLPSASPSRPPKWHSDAMGSDRARAHDPARPAMAVARAFSRVTPWDNGTERPKAQTRSDPPGVRDGDGGGVAKAASDETRSSKSDLVQIKRRQLHEPEQLPDQRGDGAPGSSSDPLWPVFRGAADRAPFSPAERTLTLSGRERACAGRRFGASETL
jgi:hypothetical protein